MLTLLVLPYTRLPIQVFVQRLFSFPPSEIIETKRVKLLDYNWQLNKMDSGSLNFSRSQGKVIIVNIWATWCPPCVAEMPSLQNLYERYGRQVDFYFITSEKEAIAKNFLAKNGYTTPIYFPKSEAPEKLSASVLPTTYLISKSGEFIIAEEGAADWDNKNVENLLEKFLKE